MAGFDPSCGGGTRNPVALFRQVSARSFFKMSKTLENQLNHFTTEIQCEITISCDVR